MNHITIFTVYVQNLRKFLEPRSDESSTKAERDDEVKQPMFLKSIHFRAIPRFIALSLAPP